MEYNRLYPQIERPDDAIPAIFDHEMKAYRRGLVCGMYGSQTVKTGGGKSLSTASICLDYDSTFNVDRILFTPAGILRMLTKGVKRGQMIIAEEAQNYASNRTWFSLYNKTIMHTVATMRNLRACIWFITPMSRMIDNDVQKMMRYTAQSSLVLEESKWPYSIAGYVRISEIYTYNHDKDIGHAPIKLYCQELGQVIEIDKLRVFLPPDDFIRDYEQKVDEYKQDYRGSILEEAEQFDAAEKALYRHAGAFRPKEMAQRMLEDPAIIREFSEKGGISQGTVTAFFPTLKRNQEISGVKWWAEQSWRDLNQVKSRNEPAK